MEGGGGWRGGGFEEEDMDMVLDIILNGEHLS